MKTKCFFLILTAVLLSACVLCGCGSNSAQQDPATTDSSSHTVDELQTQIKVLQNQNAKLSTATEMPQAISSAEDFLQRYFTVDTSSSKRYDVSELYSHYQDVLTDKAKALMKPAEEHTQEISMVSSISRIKTFGSAAYGDTVQTLSVMQLVTDISGIKSSTNHLIQLTLKKVDNVWLIDSMDYDQTLDNLTHNIF